MKTSRTLMEVMRAEIGSGRKMSKHDEMIAAVKLSLEECGQREYSPSAASARNMEHSIVKLRHARKFLNYWFIRYHEARNGLIGITNYKELSLPRIPDLEDDQSIMVKLATERLKGRTYPIGGHAVHKVVQKNIQPTT